MGLRKPRASADVRDRLQGASTHRYPVCVAASPLSGGWLALIGTFQTWPESRSGVRRLSEHLPKAPQILIAREHMTFQTNCQGRFWELSKLFRNVPSLTSLETSPFRFWLFAVSSIVGLARSAALRSPKRGAFRLFLGTVKTL